MIPLNKYVDVLKGEVWVPGGFGMAVVMSQGEAHVIVREHLEGEGLSYLVQYPINRVRIPDVQAS